MKLFGVKFNVKKIEFVFFLLITLLNILPIVSFKFFPTLDGPAHLYNSNLINHLLFSDNSQLNMFFMFNHEPVPNWSGHIILSLFNLFLPAFLAEKFLLLLYMIGLPFAFRVLIKTISPDNYFFSYLIFPFTYPFLLILGFYNTCIAIVLLLVTLTCWIKFEENLTSVKNIIILFILFIATYFSHLFIFGILLIIICLHIFTKTIFNWVNTYNFKKALIISIRKSLILFLITLLPLSLLFYYFYSRQSTGVANFINHEELLSWIKNIRPIISLNFLAEEKYTKKIFYIIIVILIIAVYNKINSIKVLDAHSFKEKIKYNFNNIFSINDFLLLSAIVFLFLYFIMPDSDGVAGYVSVRFCLLFFIVLCIWLSVQKFSKWFMILSICGVLFLHFKLNNIYSKAASDLSKIAVQCSNASKYIEPNSVVLPLNYSENWLQGHFNNYLGIDKPMVILENYECGLSWFPLKWNEKFFPNNILGDFNSNQELQIMLLKNETQYPVKVDYVFILGDIYSKTDSANRLINKIVIGNYKLLNSDTVSYKLYGIKK